MDDSQFEARLAMLIPTLNDSPGLLAARKPDELIRMFRSLRAMKADIDREAKDRTAPIKALLASTEGHLLQKMQDLGLESVRTDYGTGGRKLNRHVRVKDWPVFLAWAQEHEEFRMLKRDVTKTEVQQFIDEHKQVPPGIDVYQEIVLSVTKPQ